jgi:Universal stress protein family
MSYKTILVHLNDKRRAEAVLGSAIHLAIRHNAHLIGLHVSRVSDLDADLLVMGAYGHSRMREFVFGGTTRHIARHMTVPTLFSH